MKKILIKRDDADDTNIFSDNYLEIGIRIDEALEEARYEKENNDYNE